MRTREEIETNRDRGVLLGELADRRRAELILEVALDIRDLLTKRKQRDVPK